jgi:hypothetical protein
MKNKYNKRKYKLQAGVQQIQMDTPDYGKAYEIQAEQSAANKGISQVAQQFSGSFAPVGQVGGMAADVIRSRSKNKKTGATVGGAVEMGTSGAALGMQLGGPWGAAAGAVVGGVYGGIKGAKNYEKVKSAAQEEERKVEVANFNKQFVEGNSTDAQATLAKRGKYKVKTKQPRLIETEGREPIFSPKKKDGSRDLLYYNPNDPTHEEGGVKAVVMPKKKYTNGTGDLQISPNNANTFNSIATGTAKPYTRKPNDPIVFGQEPGSFGNKMGQVLALGKQTMPGQGYQFTPSETAKQTAISYATGASMGKLMSPVLKNAKPVMNKGANLMTTFMDTTPYVEKLGFKKNGTSKVQAFKNKYNNGTNSLMPKRSKESLVGSGIMAVGAKQIKVNDLNNTAFSQNLSNTPPANAANAFIQPQAGINQVARQIPQERRKETKRTIRSHKKVNPDLNKIVDPPTTYDMMERPPLSRVNKDTLYEAKLPKPTNTYNTKNNFKNGGKYIKVYKEGTDGTESGATYKHTKTFKSKPAYQAALQAHDDSLNLYSQSRYFTDKVKGSGLYNSTVENPEVKNITRSGLGRAPSPLKAYGSPNDASEEIMTVAGMNPMRKDLYSRKESQYKSFKEHKEAEASGQPHGTHEGYEINMYKHPEMALNYVPDTAKTIEPRRAKFKTSSDNSTTTRTPVRQIQTPTKETIVDTSKIKTTPVVATKSTATRGKFVGREKTLLDKAGEFLNKVGSSKRMSNGKSVRVFK